MVNTVGWLVLFQLSASRGQHDVASNRAIHKVGNAGILMPVSS
jgi:hypothetical protein